MIRADAVAPGLQPGRFGRIGRSITDGGIAVHGAAFAASLGLGMVMGGPLIGSQALIAAAAFVLLALARIAIVLRRGARRAAWIDPLARSLPLMVGGALGLTMVYYGAPDSPLLPLAAAAAWESGRRSPAALLRHGALFSVTYLAGGLVLRFVPGLTQPEVVIEVAKSLGLVWLGGLVGVVVGRAAGSRGSGLRRLDLERPDAERQETRAQIARALRHEPLPVESLIAGAQAGLAVRETELLAFLVMGFTNLEIADALCVSEATVKYRLTRLYRRLGVPRRADAIAYARSADVGQVPGAGGGWDAPASP